MDGSNSAEIFEEMGAGIRKLNRLRGRSSRELTVRGRQALAKLSERLFGLSTGEPGERVFLRHIKPTLRCTSAREAADLVLDRIRGSIRPQVTSKNSAFFPSLSCRAQIVESMRSEFSGQMEAIIDRADRAIQGRFDLLGFENLSFGNPPDWLLEPVSGKRAPFDHWSVIDYLNPAITGDKKITWELNRHQHFVTLGQAYWLTLDEKYAEAFVAQATSWMDANPPKLGINWVSSLELAFRSISWLWALHLFAESPRLTSGFVLRLLKHLLAHGLHIQSYLSSYFSPNTHLTGEALGLFYLGSVLPEFRCADDWRDRGLEIMLDELAHQIRDDGVYFEHATYYHRYTADFYNHLIILARAGGIALPEKVHQNLERIITHLVCIMRPDGSSPLVGDDDGGRLTVLGVRNPDDFRDTVATAAALCGRDDWKRAAGENAVETLWLLGPVVDARARQEVTPIERSIVFRSSGQAVLRDEWSKDSAYTLMDCGPHGSLAYAHSHADALSIEFAALGKTWIVDPGTYTYTADRALRDWFRSTEAHNTATVDGQSQSVADGPFSWKCVAQSSLDDFIIDDGFDYVEGSHNGYERLADPVRHTRAVIHPKTNTRNEPLGSYVIVRDTFAASSRHKYAIRYHLAPGCSAFASGNQATVREPGGLRLTIVCFGGSMLRARIDKGWVSRVYGRREPAQIVVFESTGTGSQEFITFLLPSRAGQPVTVEPRSTVYAAANAFQVTANLTHDVLLFSDASRPVDCEPLTAQGLIAWSRFHNFAFDRGFLIGGRRFETGDGYGFQAESPVRHCSLRQIDGLIRIAVNGGEPSGLEAGEQSRIWAANGTTFEFSQPDPMFGQCSGLALSKTTSEAIN